MAEIATITANIEADLEQRASAVLQNEGMTISDAVTEMLRRTVDAGTLPFQKQAMNDPDYEAWFRARVQEELDDPSPTLSHQEVKEQWAAQRRRILSTLQNRDAA